MDRKTYLISRILYTYVGINIIYYIRAGTHIIILYTVRVTDNTIYYGIYSGGGRLTCNEYHEMDWDSNQTLRVQFPWATHNV